MRILFWNTKGNCEINKYLSCIIEDYDIDIAVLAEYKASPQDLIIRMRRCERWFEQYNTIGCDRLTILGDYKNIEPAEQNYYYSIQIIDKRYVLCGIHMPSDLHGDRTNERHSIAQLIMADVHDAENIIKSTSTIIVGDFNEMPYGYACLGADAFHGLPFYNCEGKGNLTRRTVYGSKYVNYYNPMWSFLGDFSYPPGTYYRSEAVLYTPMWYLLDQFIFGQDLIPLLNKKEMRIITTCSGGNLYNSKGHPNKSISDHFPIMCEIEE